MLPRETRLALFPRGRAVCRLGWFGTLRLGPVTLAHAAAMEALDVGFLDGWMDDANALMAAWVLSLSPSDAAKAANRDLRGADRFMRRLKGRVADVTIAVNALADDALLPFVPPKQEQGVVLFDDGLPKGYGWPLEVAEALCSRYGWSFDEAMAIPLPRALALMAVGRENRGGEAGGPDYYDRIRLERWKAIGIIPAKGIKEAANG